MIESDILKVGEKAPDFTLVDIDQTDVKLSDYRGDKNVLLVFYPLAFTPVCSTQIPGYQKIYDLFEDLETEVVTISVDSTFTHKAWADGLGGISFPMLSDFWPHGEVTAKYGLLNESFGGSERALILIDKEGTIRYVDIVDLKVIPEIEPVLDMLKSWLD